MQDVIVKLVSVFVDKALLLELDEGGGANFLMTVKILAQGVKGS